ELSFFFDDSTAVILADDLNELGFPGLVVLTTDDNPLEETADFIGFTGLPDIVYGEALFFATLGLEAVTQDPDPVDVAEPSSIALLGLGLTGFALARRRRS
ncbi:MAG: PEP-CTERM sorting domain-containing protein, partial [Pseudomonadota bacterium]